MSTFASGFSCMSCGSTSRPVCSGMTMSSRITSGLSARAWKTASRALPASPTGSMSSSASSRSRRPAADDRVVVDDQDTDAHERAPRPRASCRRPGATRSRAGRRPGPAARACRSRPTPLRAHGSRVEAGSVVLDHRRHRGLASRERDADVVRVRVLDDVRQRLLHDPVERRSRPRSAAASRRAPSGSRPESPTARRTSSISRSSAGTRPKSSSTAGRSSTARRRTSWSALTTSSRSCARSARAGWSASASSSGFSPSRIEVSACPVSSWSSRASRWRSSSCACDDAAHRVARHPLRQLDRHGGAGGERLGEPQVVVGEARVGTLLVVDLEHADRLARGRSAAPTCRSGRRAAARPPGAPRDRRAPSRCARCAGAASTRRSSTRSGRCVVPSRSLGAGDGGEAQLVAAARKRERDDPRVEQLAQPRGRSRSSSRSRSVSVASAFPTSFSDWSWRDQRVDAS